VHQSVRSSSRQRLQGKPSQALPTVPCNGGIDILQGIHQSIHGSKQKIALFCMQLLIANNRIMSDQEEEDAYDAAKPSHLKPSGCSLTAGLYPECTEILYLINIIKQHHIL